MKQELMPDAHGFGSTLVQEQQPPVSFRANRATGGHGVTAMVQGISSDLSETVATVKDGVASSVATVRRGMRETLQSLKHSFGLNCLAEQYPWSIVAGAALVGYVLGRGLDGAPRPAADLQRRAR